MTIIVNIMTCYKVIKEAVVQSQHLAYMESLVRRLACPPGWGHDILKFHGVMPRHMWKFETTRSIYDSFTAQDFLRAIMPLVEQLKRRPFLEGGILKTYVESDITNCHPLHVCKISGQLVTRATWNFFPKSRWPQGKRSIMACRGKSTNKWWQTPLNRWLHKRLLHLMHTSII